MSDVTYKNNKPKTLKQIGLLCARSIVYVAIFLTGSYLSQCANPLIQILLLSIIIIGYVYYCKINKLSILQSIGFVSVLGFLMSYISFRMAYGAIMPMIETELVLTASKSGNFNAIFSLTYGLGQILVGILINAFGLYAVGFASVGAGITAFAMCVVQAKYHMLYVLRGLLGFFCAFGSIGVASYISQYWPQDIFNTSMGLSQSFAAFMASIVAYSASKAADNVSGALADWRPIQTKLSLALLVSGVAILIVAFVMSRQTSTTATSKQEEGQSTNKPSLQESLRVLFSKKYIMSFLWTSACCGLMYINNTFDSLIAAAYPESSKLATTCLSMVAGVIVLILPDIINTFPNYLSVIYRVSSILQAVGFVLLMFFYEKSKIIIVISYIFFVLSGYTHMILPVAINNDRQKHGDTPFFFGVMNFGTMFFGSYVVQEIIGVLVDLSWKSHKSMNALSQAPIYHASDYISALKYFAPLVIITLISSFFVLDATADTTDTKN